MANKVIMPQLGESVVEGTVTKWLKKEGEAIKEFETLLEINTDKVDTEIPSPAGGTILKLLVPEGTTVKAGTILAWIGEPGEKVPEESGAPATAAPAPAAVAAQPIAPAVTSPAPAKVAAPTAAPISAPPSAKTNAPDAGHDLGFISPVVAKIAREQNVDLSQVTGSGQGGRITKKDVMSFIEKHGAAGAPVSAAIPIWETPADGDLFRPMELMGSPQPVSGQVATQTPAVTQPTAGDQVVPFSIIRRSIAEHMSKSKTIAPHVTTVMEADLSKVVAHREANLAVFARDNTRLTYTAYFVEASVNALKAFPQVNSSWSEAGLVLHSAINIGMAVSLGEEGLIVPVIKAADGLSMLGLARAVNDLAERARARKLQPEEVKGGTFTITNHGTSNSLFATPIINQPQVAILGVGAIQKRAVVVNDAIAIRPMVYLSLSFDHRVLDGASADWFLAKIVERLQNWS